MDGGLCENMKNKRAVGTQYEQIAADYLIKEGFQILERNFRCRQGEIDLIAREGEWLVFLEVKYRKTAALGEPAEAIDRRKQERIYRAAEYYLYRFCYGRKLRCRFDVVVILGEEISLIRNAFGGM